MGCCFPCCNAVYEPMTPNPEQRRQRAAAAAESRMKEQESRGVRNPESVKRLQQQSNARDRMAEVPQGGGSGLRWQIG